MTREAVLETMGATLARWQLPDDVLVVADLPLTATGKIDKKALRARHQDHLTAGMKQREDAASG